MQHAEEVLVRELCVLINGIFYKAFIIEYLVHFGVAFHPNSHGCAGSSSATLFVPYLFEEVVQDR